MIFAGLIVFDIPKASAQDADFTLVDKAYSHDRSILGFQNDSDYLARMDATYSVDAYFGFPMTPIEHAELVRRALLAPSIAAVEKNFSGRGDYSGIWFDQLKGGVVTIALTEQPTESDDKTVEATLPLGTPYATVIRKNSKAALDAIHNKISQDIIDGTEPDHVSFNSSAVSVESSVVTISIPTSTSEAEANDIASYYGLSLVEVIRGEPYHSTSVGNWDYTTGRLLVASG